MKEEDKKGIDSSKNSNYGKSIEKKNYDDYMRSIIINFEAKVESLA